MTLLTVILTLVCWTCEGLFLLGCGLKIFGIEPVVTSRGWDELFLLLVVGVVAAVLAHMFGEHV